MRYLRLRALLAIVAAASSLTAACGSDKGNGGWPDDSWIGSGGWTGNGGSGGTGGGGDGGSGGGWKPAASLCLETRPVNVVPPAGLQVRFRALDCDGNPVRPLTAGDVSVINDEKGVPFGKGGEGDSVSGVGENSNVELYSVLVLDLSNSIFAAGAVDAVIDGALAFVDETVTQPTISLKHSVAVIAFGRPDAITVEQSFTKDDALLKAKLEALRTSAPRGTTDLYDAYMMGLQLVSQTGSGGDSVIERFVVLLTDGTHEAGDEENLRQQALSAKHATDATVYTIGIQGNYDACRLEELAGRGLDAMSQGAGCRELGACSVGTAQPASCTQFFPDADPSALSKVFEDIAARATGIARSNYVVGVCTPVSLGSPTLTLSVTVDGQEDEATLAYSVSHLNGDVNTCNAESIQKGKLYCDYDDACQVVCLDKQCGADYGVSCGSCGDKQLCNAAQHCEDVCIGMSCGTDKGVSCGSCSGNQYCNGAYACVSPCQGMNCGTDHGVSCGSCSGYQYCNGANKCTSPCEGMDCGTDQGVSCGSCGNKQICGAMQQCEDVCMGMACGTDQGVSCGSCGNKQICDAMQQCKDVCIGSACGTVQGIHCGSCSVAQLALGHYHSCARLTDGTVRCWGNNGYGQLGADAALWHSYTPIEVPGLTGVAHLALGPEYSCARLTDGTARCWGNNGYGQLGDGTLQSRFTPTVVPGLTGVAELALGSAHTCARLTDGTVQCWGNNGYGQLGDGTTQNKLTPTSVPGLTGVAELALGNFHTCARLTDGTVRCWGSNGMGQLGDGTTQARLTPTPVPGLTGVAELALGMHHTCARLTGGTVQCWGLNNDGQLGDGTAGTSRNTPTPVPGLTGVTELALGHYHSCARLTDGTIRCWGDNDYGQLGDGTAQPKLTPTVVPGLTGVAELALGSAHTCARLTGGDVRCWGRNEGGQLGDGTDTNRLTPTLVLW